VLTDKAVYYFWPRGVILQPFESPKFIASHVRLIKDVKEYIRGMKGCCIFLETLGKT
jgi:hypothetical protein